MTLERGLRVIRSGASYRGRQGLTYLAGLDGETAGARGICMTIATLPPGARSKAHFHRGIETAVYVIAGEVETCYGAGLEGRAVSRAGDYVYIPPDLPHLVINRSAAECTALIAHTSASDQDGIELLPELDALV